MAVFVIGDLHLSISGEKPMHIFGEKWRDHHLRIEKNWKKLVTEGDAVILAGDSSWALKFEEAKTDLDWIKALPGKKIFLKGNHDYWWTSLKRMKSAYPEFEFIYNNSIIIEDTEFVGTRGWMLEPGDDEASENAKIFKREVNRLKNSIAAARSELRKICILHYPPFDYNGFPTEINELIEAAGIKEVYFGHIHANYDRVRQGEVNSIKYRLVSADYLSFIPYKIL